MTDGAIHEALAETMAKETRQGARTIGQLADALLPVVSGIVARERAEAVRPFVKAAADLGDELAKARERVAWLEYLHYDEAAQ